MPGLPRRSLLRGLGIGLVAAPFLNLLSAPRSRAEGAAARRLIVFFSPNGTVPKHWAPSGSETDFSFPAGSILEPLTPVQDKLIVVEGLDFFGADNHEGGMMAMLTASGGLADESGGASLDQFVAGKIGQDSRFASLEFGVQTSAWGAGVQTRMSYSAPGAWVSPDDDPAHVYSRLFGDFMGGDQAATALLPEEISRLLSPLDQREREILKLRFGLDRGEPRTLEEVGEHFNLTRERIRQIEARAMSKLRHPSSDPGAPACRATSSSDRARPGSRTTTTPDGHSGARARRRTAR